MSYAQRHSGRGRKTVDDVVLEITRSRTGVNLTATHPLYIVEYYREALRPPAGKKKPRRSRAKWTLMQVAKLACVHAYREG